MAGEVLKAHEKRPLSSKKFLAFIIAEVTWKVIMGFGLWILRGHLEDATAWVWWWMITATVCTTFLEVGTVLGLAYVDRFVRVAAIAVQAGGEKPDGPEFLNEEAPDVGRPPDP